VIFCRLAPKIPRYVCGLTFWWQWVFRLPIGRYISVVLECDNVLNLVWKDFANADGPAKRLFGMDASSDRLGAVSQTPFIGLGRESAYSEV
jgi:hypothetical protein